MLSIFEPLAATKPLIKKFADKLIEDGFVGDIRTDYSTRLLNATDNSIYELMPEAVIQPYHLDDLVRLMKAANQQGFADLSFSARGGGTGTNGQSLTNQIVVDFSRHMTRILDFNSEAQTITVEAGIILSELNRFLLPHGLFFAPNVSTENRATIGGMIATDAAGKGSLIYGKTSDHISHMKLILADGTVINTEEYTPESPHQLYQQIIGLLNTAEVQHEINLRFPPLKRPLSGYNIKQCFQHGVFDLTRLICGSEGTLGMVASATLKLLPIPKHKTLVVVHYNTFIDALKAASELIRHHPLAIEAVDEKVQKSAQTLPNWQMLAQLLNSVGKNYISNFIEFVDNDQDILKQRVLNLTTELDTRGANYVVITDKVQINQLWSIRSLAVGLAGKIPGSKKPVAFVEDAIVPPENLADFVAELQEFLQQKQLGYAMYGHVDVGCIHVRPALDMQDVNDRQQIRPITLEVNRLLNKYHGILWGEHGKGFRGEFVPEVFGELLYPILCKIKAIFDPHNRLNPGKLAIPSYSSISGNNFRLTQIDEVVMRGELDQVISKSAQVQFNGAMLCNGNGACFNREPSNVMCPSYKVTQDRIHSPKGRAMLVKEWLRKQSQSNSSDGSDDRGVKEVAEMVMQAMDGCLGCKGCAGKCPTQVSIPDLSTTFINNFHNYYKRRNVYHVLNVYIEHLLLITVKMPRIWNFLVNKKLIPSFGMNDLPLFNLEKSLIKILKQKKINLYHDSLCSKLPVNAVVIYVDAFTGLLEGGTVLFALIDFITKLEFIPYVIYPRVSGKALIVGGFIKVFKKNTEQLARLFNPLFEREIPIVGLENTVVLMFRDEVAKFATKFAGNMLTMAEFISQNSNKNNDKLAKLNSRLSNNKYKLLPHCTEQAIAPNEAALWQQIFTNLGLELEVQNTGCCGMAGNYGHQKSHEQHSKDLFNMHWSKHLATYQLSNLSELDHKQVEFAALATGFSCRSQAKRLAKINIKHPIEILALKSVFHD
ncbi:MAG: hypothetical protein QG673_843 [Pseudomonadota bacterium]|nr:hypothetical protein [Pseudomonadota bacterium]